MPPNLGEFSAMKGMAMLQKTSREQTCLGSSPSMFVEKEGAAAGLHARAVGDGEARGRSAASCFLAVFVEDAGSSCIPLSEVARHNKPHDCWVVAWIFLGNGS